MPEIKSVLNNSYNKGTDNHNFEVSRGNSIGLKIKIILIIGVIFLAIKFKDEIKNLFTSDKTITVDKENKIPPKQENQEETPSTVEPDKSNEPQTIYLNDEALPKDPAVIDTIGENNNVTIKKNETGKPTNKPGVTYRKSKSQREETAPLREMPIKE